LSLESVAVLDILKQSSFRTPTDLDALKDVLAWFDQFQSLPMDHEVWLQCQLALTEGFTNAVRHAHHDCPPDTPIEVEVVATPEVMDLKIWDRGPGFDFEAMLRRKLATTDQDAEGGRGLRIIHRVADEVRYQRFPNQQNCLYLRKVLTPQSADSV
jgi:serine/threonine-protein kinase RsbW